MRSSLQPGKLFFIGSPWLIGYIITVIFKAAILIALRAILATLVYLEFFDT
jgi:hypothetical protein